jgi:hypothetical protein
MKRAQENFETLPRIHSYLSRMRLEFKDFWLKKRNRAKAVPHSGEINFNINFKVLKAFLKSMTLT